ncbi:MAG: hypothetical protein SFV23_15535 [Planctomycetaceae bacterium]|nr:hypothetical protein [Planctomycetaceae bacterium]
MALEDTSQYVQVYVSQELADEVAKLGSGMQLSAPDAASRMLYCAVELEGWIIFAINSRMVRSVLKGMGVKGSENAAGNLEPRAAKPESDAAQPPGSDRRAAA